MLTTARRAAVAALSALVLLGSGYAWALEPLQPTLQERAD